MDKIEFKPKFLAPSRMIMFIFFFVVTIIILATLVPATLNLWKDFPSQDNLVITILPLSMVVISLILVLAFIYFSTQNKLITIDGRLLYYKTNSFFQGQKIQVVDLQNIEYVKDIQKIQWIFTGKVILPISWFNFIFQDNNDKQTEISLFGWDKETLVQLINYIRGHYPKIKINTFVHQDSLEKYSGIEEYVNSVKPK